MERRQFLKLSMIMGGTIDVSKGLLPRLHGYELLMAPYAIAHLKIGLKLYESGYLRVYT